MPNCEQLAKSGVVFGHAYTGPMTCGPSRVVLNTGLHPIRLGPGRSLAPEIETLPRTLVKCVYMLSHPDGYSPEAEHVKHEKKLVDLGYAQPVSSIYRVESMARYRDFPLKWKCARRGWRTSWTAVLQNGQYYTPTFSGLDPSGTGTIGGVPDRIGNGNISNRSVSHAFDPTAFAIPGCPATNPVCSNPVHDSPTLW